MLSLAPEPIGSADLQYASWGPRGSQLVFVQHANIYYKASAESAPQEIASSPQESIIANGIPDWLYEEEILSKSNAIWFSPSGTRLCYASFNDSLVDEMSYPYYGAVEDPQNLYPGMYNIRYPKPGRRNPTVKLWVVDVATRVKTTHVVIPPKEVIDT